MQLGDARQGKWPQNMVGFARALRRAGVGVDSRKISLAIESAQIVGLANKLDFEYALEAVLVSHQNDRSIFKELFDLYFKDPKWANQLLTQMLPTQESERKKKSNRARVSDAMRPNAALSTAATNKKDDEVEFDATMTASELSRLRQADFHSLQAHEYQLVQRLAQETPLRIPQVPTRRKHSMSRGSVIHWSKLLQRASAQEGETLTFPLLGPQRKPLPLLVLIDVSGSMERYARMLLAFFHQSTKSLKARQFMAFGTELTDLTSAFKMREVDDMLTQTNALIKDFAGGTRLGHALGELRAHHANKLVAKRTMVLLVSDGLDTGDVSELERELKWLKRSTRKVLWLNPLLRFDAYEPLAKGANLLNRYADKSLAIHNLNHLRNLTEGLEELVKS
jgi:uncharacterized protein with von Willebrand factor type A (vWA) domain